jgi:hypothetical protein
MFDSTNQIPTYAHGFDLHGIDILSLLICCLQIQDPKWSWYPVQVQMRWDGPSKLALERLEIGNSYKDYLDREALLDGRRTLIKSAKHVMLTRKGKMPKLQVVLDRDLGSFDQSGSSRREAFVRNLGFSEKMYNPLTPEYISGVIKGWY